jgi:hypothetical protein
VVFSATNVIHDNGRDKVISDLLPATDRKTDGIVSTTMWRRFGPLVLVGAAVLFGLWSLRSELTVVPYPNDSSVHEEMALFAAQLFAHGHFPLDSWYPFLGLGSPQFLHYQSLGVMLTGLVGVIFGVATTFAWTLYLLLASWPISVYVSARLFGWDRWPSAIAAAAAPFIIGSTGVGFEQVTYLFSGFGVWTQLWAMWTLPLAWAFSWRAVSERKYVLPAVLFVSLTAAFHFLTGYLAFIPLALWPFIKPSEILRRILRAAIVGIGALLVSAWVVIPLISYGNWAALNEFLQHSPDTDSYGARQILTWLIEGNIYDYGHFPVVTIFVFFGLVACVARFKKDLRARALVCIWVLSLVLYFGRPTLGPLFDLLPGSRDLFLRRFVMGVQLSGLYLAGVGVVALYEVIRQLARRYGPRIVSALSSGRMRIAVRRIGLAGLFVLVFAPAWTQTSSTDIANGQAIAYQQQQDNVVGKELAVIVARIKVLGGGRTYAGLDAPGNWGLNLVVGDTAVFKVLAADEVPEVGYTLRTASLMSDPESYFDEYLPADYSLFAVRFMILASGSPPPVPAHQILHSGPFTLWTVKSAGYVQVVDTTAPLVENRSDIGAQSAAFVRSNLAEEAIYPTVAYNGQPAATPTIPAGIAPMGAPGTVIRDEADLTSGYVRATIVAHRTSVVLLKASFDPGWTVRVDGVIAQPEMIAPAYIGVTVRPGTHSVVFQYKGYRDYPLLFGIAVLTILLFLLGPWIWKRASTRRRGAL